MQAFLWKINLWNLSPRRRKKAVTCTHFTTLSHIACNQEQIDWRKKVNCVRSSTSSLGCRDEKKKPTREKNIFRDTCLFWKKWYMVLLHSTLSIDTQALRRLRISRWCLCLFALFRLLACVCECVCVFFTFYRCFAEYEKSKYWTTAISSLHIWSIGWLVGWLSGWLVRCCFYVFFIRAHFFRFHYLFSHCLYRENEHLK